MPTTQDPSTSETSLRQRYDVETYTRENQNEPLQHCREQVHARVTKKREVKERTRKPGIHQQRGRRGGKREGKKEEKG